MTATLDDNVADLRRVNAELQQKLDERTRERDEALEQQTATAEVLQVINSSPGELAPIFDAMLEKTLSLCDAVYGHVYTYDGERVHPVAIRGEADFIDWLEKLGPYLPGPGSPMERTIRGERIVHVADALQEEAYRTAPGFKKLIDASGIRTGVTVGLCKEDMLLGAINIYRKEVRPFSEKQIALLENFAAQAVIAIENARLITETREALEQQTATAEVLQVINASPGDLAPVFDAMLDKAIRLSEATHSHLFTYDGDLFHLAAARGEPRYIEWQRQAGPVQPYPSSSLGQIKRGQQIVHVAGIREEEVYRALPKFREQADLRGVRSEIAVALIKDNILLGAMVVYRQEVRPFTDKQIALLQNFAAQAVIAMENARLITETREALEQQTATAEVLQVINSSPGDLAPVFDAMLEKATRLCEAPFGILRTWDGECFHFGAVHGDPRFCDWVRQRGPIRTDTDASLLGRIQAGERVVHITDAQTDEAYRVSAGFREMAEASSIRSAITVALHKDDALLGIVTVYRQEFRPFSEKQIALLQNFAAQAVIAMENARLITETREALGQQTATAEVLQVINSSPGDLTPVFDAMLEKALRLCEAAFGLLHTYDGERFRALAIGGVSGAAAEPLREWVADPGSALEQIVRGDRVVHIRDVVDTDAYRSGIASRLKLVKLTGARTALWVALRKDDVLIGVFVIYRREVRPFSDKQIALVQNFAAQAVIAMENARLLTETREALEQQTATAEVLQVINSSPGVLAPVFDTLLEKAMRLCEAAFGEFIIAEGERVRAVAVLGAPAAFAEIRMRSAPPSPGSIMARVLAGELVIHTVDARDDDLYRRGDPHRLVLVDLAGARTTLAVTLIKDGAVLGAIHIYRQEVKPFTDKQIALLRNFAAQAVIAMENARLLTETREALEQQTATANILRVISSSPTDVQPTFEAIASAAATLCGAVNACVFQFDGSLIHFVANYGLTAEQVAATRRVFPIPPGRGSITARAILSHQIAHVADFLADPEFAHPSLSQGGLNTTLSVPMLHDGQPIGAITLVRQEKELFSDKQIDLLNTFADQAVIAIENVRLFNALNERTRDLQESLEYQTATSDVLKVISRSTFDLQPVFETIVETATRLCDADDAIITNREGDAYRLVASFAASPEFDAVMQGRLFTVDRGSLTGRTALAGQAVHIHDIASDPEYTQTETITLQKNRTMLGVPLLRDGVVVGTINLGRTRVQDFTERQTELVRTFADQAVIAIENARLLGEIRQRQAELRTTFDNMGDGVVMFDETLHLAAWNRNFQQILDLPDALLMERPSYTDYVRMLAARGEFGTEDIEAELSRRLEHTDQEFRMERTRPDGRVIEVRRNAVPGGGFVLIYSDITERKRSETEIRAARDNAEAAYRDLKAAQANLIQAEKMASLGQLTAGIAHEIKNPLNFVNNFAGLSVELLDELKETAAPAISALEEERRVEVDETIDMLTGNLNKIAEHGRRADNIVKSMLEHSRGSSGERRQVDLNGLIEEALNLAYHGARAQDQSFNIALKRDFGQGILPIELVPQDITRVCLNLIGNGFYAAAKRQKEGGDPTFNPSLKVSTRDLSDVVEIRVHDNGTGIPPEIKDKLFQPFFTTKPTGEGTGLGLSISYDIVTQQHGGTIEVDSRVGEFSEFTVRLPRAYRATMAQAAS